MYNAIHSASVFGVEGKNICVEVDISNGLPQVHIVGLPDPAVRESVERVRAALKNSGFNFPMERITVNLAPADLRKEGTAFDVAIAAGILTASGQLGGAPFKDTLLIGELSLSGSIGPVPGVLAMLERAKRSGISRVLLPAGNVQEAAWISGMELYGLTHLHELAGGGAERGWERLRHAAADSGKRRLPDSPPQDGLDFHDVIGQQQAKRAMLIAASGKHNILLCGPPGTGKTMMIRRLPGILPPLVEEEALEVTKIYSVAGKLSDGARGLMASPPFRAPHHSISAGGMIGGGSIPKPGEVTLAHRGILFLDELPEFPRAVLELLRQPLEDRIVTISRSRATVQFPANLMLAVSYNPCPCGYFGYEHGEKICTCSPTSIARYRSKLSGPLLDRIDLQLEVPRPRFDQHRAGERGLTTVELQRQVVAARTRQLERNRTYGVRFNSELTGSGLLRAAALHADARMLLDNAFEALGISMRAYDRILKLARTIADLEDCDSVRSEHVAEAISYRRVEP
ncbi:YifB family Mg chelatase-like AAA ATPase [Paenibacillus sp. J5C_2022]|uniref:YifB family Mg chelatase-like AAA ATPase n=1 Tax=Paenibacillus sp. J5C2022 TaxID=2977129 RepID=UPI0021CEE758|nr:YifB family Mg chelatase-like AAA ATPase [Paenibacillus sp. J5C2022]MCU6707087.1 YifB family Mg chelatase-like AAA ATPase [Paenibacillus sp. J5C2022]